MTNASWRIDDPEPQPLAATSGGPGLVSLHFVLTALRREWRVWAGLAAIGMLLGVAWSLHSPPKDVATVTLMLAHDPATDPAQSMATDVSLLRTGTVANDVIRRLRLDMSPYELQTSVVVQAVSNNVLVLDVSGPDDAAAVSRARTLADSFLEFRATQLRSQSNALTRGYGERITTLREESARLNEQYEALRRSTPAGSARASELLDKMSQAGTQTESAQQAIEDASFKTDSIIAASYVLDPPAARPDPSTLKGVVFAMAAGVIAGTATGVILVLLRALTSDRLRLREEVALALAAPVRVTVGEVRARSTPWRLRRSPTRSQARQLLVQALDAEIPRPQIVRSAGSGHEDRPREAGRRISPTRMALAAVDSVEPAELVVAALAARLSAEGLAVFVVDLTEAGGLGPALARAWEQQGAPSSRPEPVLHRPDGVPALARGPAGLSVATSTDLPPTDPCREAWDRADVALTLVEVDPALGVEHVASWADQVVVLVTAGRSSAERLSTVAELIRAAGLRLHFAMLVGSTGRDDSLGLPDTQAAPKPPHVATGSR